MTTDSIATEADFSRHAQNLASGFASMTPAPRRFTNPNPRPAPEADAVEAVTPESTDQRVLRESGVVGRHDLRWVGLADIESLTSGLATKKELARFAEIEAALSRLAEEIDASGKTPINISKIAASLSPGELPTAEAIAVAVAGDEGRMVRRKIIKESARRFFEEQATPIIRDICTRAAALLETAITERRKAEVQAFEKFVEIYGDEDGTPYQPSKGLLRLLARRRQLLDHELTFTSPPSLRASLAGVLSF